MQARKLFAVLQFWTLATLIPFWLITVRGAFEPDYAWGFLSLSGMGRTQDYWVIPMLALLGWTILYLGFRGARAPYSVLLVLWHFALAGALFQATQQGEPLLLRGDNWGFAIDLRLAGPIVCGAFGLLALFWTWRQRSRVEGERTAMPSRYGRLLMIAAAGLIPVDYVLLRAGPQLGGLDAIGVGAVLAQAVLVFAAFIPSRGAGPSRLGRTAFLA